MLGFQVHPSKGHLGANRHAGSCRRSKESLVGTLHTNIQFLIIDSGSPKWSEAIHIANVRGRVNGAIAYHLTPRLLFVTPNPIAHCNTSFLVLTLSIISHIFNPLLRTFIQRAGVGTHALVWFSNLSKRYKLQRTHFQFT